MQINIIPGVWQHFKGGLYDVLGTAKHSETEEEFVVYQKKGESNLWIRPIEMFAEIIPEIGPRFRRIE